jgi:hypothetical protein
MAEPNPSPQPALLVVAAFSRYPQVLEWACHRLEGEFGPTIFQSFPYRFDQTDYYESTMGRELWKQLLAFRDLVRLDSLADTKLKTNFMEREIAETKKYMELRPLNLDPGLLTLGKFMLATMKDQAHRIYVGKGVFAEVTLRFKSGAYDVWPWTYADYRQPQVAAFLGDARHVYTLQTRER